MIVARIGSPATVSGHDHGKDARGGQPIGGVSGGPPAGFSRTLTQAPPGTPVDSEQYVNAPTVQIQVVPAKSADGGCGQPTENVTLSASG